MGGGLPASAGQVNIGVYEGTGGPAPPAQVNQTLSRHRLLSITQRQRAKAHGVGLKRRSAGM